jgi:hypothetical protein
MVELALKAAKSSFGIKEPVLSSILTRHIEIQFQLKLVVRNRQ